MTAGSEGQTGDAVVRETGGRVVVTGAAGFIGSRLVERLAGEGRQVVAVDCLLEKPYPAAGKEERLRSLASLPGVEAHRLDLTEPAFHELLSGMDEVVNLAALAGLVVVALRACHPQRRRPWAGPDGSRPRPIALSK